MGKTFSCIIENGYCIITIQYDLEKMTAMYILWSYFHGYTVGYSVIYTHAFRHSHFLDFFYDKHPKAIIMAGI